MNKHTPPVMFVLLCALVSLVWAQTEIRSAAAQSAATTPIQCGNIIEASIRQPGTIQAYSLQLEAGDTVIVDINRISTANAPRVIIRDSTGNQLVGIPWEEPVMEVAVPFADTWLFEVSDNNISSYELFIGCKILATGELIEAGSVPFGNGVVPPPPSPSDVNDIPVAQLPNFLSTAPISSLSMLSGVPATGVITADGSEILGYNLPANASDVLDLAFSRVSGSLNLNLVVLSPERQVIFQTSLVTSSELTTRLTLPTTGAYTFVVFRVDLFPAQAADPAAFQLTATLNAS